MEEQIPKSLPGAKIIATKVESNARGVELAQIELRAPFKDASGKTIQIYERAILFQGKDTLVMVMLVSVDELRKTIQPGTDISTLSPRLCPPLVRLSETIHSGPGVAIRSRYDSGCSSSWQEDEQ